MTSSDPIDRLLSRSAGARRLRQRQIQRQGRRQSNRREFDGRERCGRRHERRDVHRTRDRDCDRTGAGAAQALLEPGPGRQFHDRHRGRRAVRHRLAISVHSRGRPRLLGPDPARHPALVPLLERSARRQLHGGQTELDPGRRAARLPAHSGRGPYFPDRAIAGPFPCGCSTVRSAATSSRRPRRSASSRPWTSAIRTSASRVTCSRNSPFPRAAFDSAVDLC